MTVGESDYISDLIDGVLPCEEGGCLALSIAFEVSSGGLGFFPF